MSVISKTLANQIAIKLTEASSKAVDNLYKEYSELATAFYEDQTPVVVKEAFAKHPDYFHTSRSICFSGHGFSWDRVTAVKSVVDNNRSGAQLTLNEKIATKLLKAKHKHEAAKKQLQDLQLETESALLANIRKELPQAEPYLPPPLSNALVVNFDSLKRKLNKQAVVPA